MVNPDLRSSCERLTVLFYHVAPLRVFCLNGLISGRYKALNDNKRAARPAARFQVEVAENF